MHKRRTSDDVLSATTNSNRKTLSSKFMDRVKNPEVKSSLNSTAQVNRNLINLQAVKNDFSIASIIQEKVANLKNKFGELDDLRRRLMDSQCDFRDDFEGKRNSLEKNRGRSTEMSMEAMKNREMNLTRLRMEKNNTKSPDFYADMDLHNERKSTQKAILEKNLAERESQEKQRSFQNQVQMLSLELENLTLKNSNLQKDLKESENLRKHQETLLHSQAGEVKTLESRLSSSNSTIKTLKNHITKLEGKLKNVNENSSTTTTAIKNLSYIILSKDSPTRVESSTQQIINKYLESLHDLQSSDKLFLSLLKKFDENKPKQVHKKLADMESEILKRLERNSNDISELENFVYECRSPSPSGKKQGPVEVSGNNEADLMSWMSCQALMIEDLLVISELGCNEDLRSL